MWCSLTTFQWAHCGSCLRTCSSSLPLSGGTPPRQGTQVLSARDDIENLLAYCSGLYRTRQGRDFQNSGKSHPAYPETMHALERLWFRVAEVLGGRSLG